MGAPPPQPPPQPEPPAEPSAQTSPEQPSPRRREDRLAAFLGVLSDAGQDLDAQGVLDVLWLAGRLTGDPAGLPLARAARRNTAADDDERARAGDAGQRQAEPGEPTDPDQAPDEDLSDITLPGLYGAPQNEEPRGPGPDRGQGDGRNDERDGSARPDGPDRARPGLPVLVPERKALPDELLIGRALRPLKRRRPSRWRLELDERATAAALAETRLPDVVTRPANERWLNLSLVVDSGLSMLLWHRLSVELQSALRRLGAFRTLQVYGLDARVPDAPVLRGRPFATDGPPLAPSVLADPSGGSLVLVLSDGMGAAWQHGSMHDVLLKWAACGPVALVHALPPALWDGSGIQADRWQATTRAPGGASTGWQVTDRVLPRELAEFSGVPVPVLEPTPESLHDWARLLTSPGTTVEIPLLARPRRRGRVPAALRPTGVQYFRDAASPEAYRLAAHLAAVSPASVPVMRLVQSAVPWPARTAHLAEVFLGGLVHPVQAPVAGPLPAKHRIFDFSEEAKRALLDTVPTSELLRTGRTIGEQLEALAGRSPDFPAWLAHPSGADTLPGSLRSFTSVERRLLARFGVRPEPSVRTPRVRITRTRPWEPLTAQDPRRLGPYRLTGRRPGTRTVVYLGQDEQGVQAAVRATRPGSPAADRTLIATEAEALRRMNGRYAPALLNTGPGRSPQWIAMRPIGPAGDPDGHAPRLAEVLDQELPPNVWVFDALNSLSMGWHLAGALSVCHMNGLAPAAFTADSVVVLERSVLLMDLSDCAVDGRYDGAGPAPTRADNVRSLGELLGRISSRPGSRAGVPDMALWDTSSWEPLRDMVMRCLAPDPLARPTAPEVTELFAQYVALARGRPRQSAGSPERSRPAAARPPLLREAVDRRGDPAPRIWRRPLLGGRGRAREEQARALSEVRRPLTHSLRATVLGAHPGCGRATTTLVLGALLAAVREEPVLAMDGAPLRGDLSRHLTHRNPATPRELAELPADSPYEDVRRFTSHLGGGLEVLAYRDSHATAGPAYAEEYRHVLEMAARHYPVVLTDWADHRLDAAVDTVLEQTDRLVLCCTTAAYSLGLASGVLTGLREQGWSRLADRAVVVAAGLGGSQTVLTAGAIRHRFEEQAGGAVVLPFDPHLSGVRRLHLDRLRSRTAGALAELAARVMAADDPQDR